MVLCRQCSNVVLPLHTRCGRCGLTWPYWRSRRRRRRTMRRLLHLTAGKLCPACGQRTIRRATPFWLRPLRTVLGDRCSSRSCSCGWRGVAVHAPRRARAARA